MSFEDLNALCLEKAVSRQVDVDVNKIGTKSYADWLRWQLFQLSSNRPSKVCNDGQFFLLARFGVFAVSSDTK